MNRIAFRAVTSCALFALATLVASASDSLDGSSWKVKVTPEIKAEIKGETPFDDTLVFAGGKVTMSECAKAGFGASSYELKTAGKGTMFSTEQTSADEGRALWKAEIEGEAIRGALIWTKKDGTTLRYTFEGKKVAKAD